MISSIGFIATPNWRACSSLYMQDYFKRCFVLHSKEIILIKKSKLKVIEIEITFPQGGHSIVKNTGGGGAGSILVGQDILGFFKNIDLDNS